MPIVSNQSGLVVRAQSGGTNDIRAIKPPVEIPNSWIWFWWVLGALVLIAAAVALWPWVQRKFFKPAPVPIIPPHVRAKNKLREALALISDPKRFCIAVSDALRVYLEERFNFRAPERTTEEFLLDLQQTTLLSPEQKESLAAFLQECDLVKFARFEPNEDELRRLHDAALRLIDETQYERIEPAIEDGSAQVTAESHA